MGVIFSLSLVQSDLELWMSYFWFITSTKEVCLFAHRVALDKTCGSFKASPRKNLLNCGDDLDPDAGIFEIIP